MDLQNKYQILAGEFAKVRGQVTVLKKAVIDEHNLSLLDTADQLQGKVAEILTAFQTGALTHCDLDKNYNEKLCLEYELNVSSEYLPTIDECISVALREFSLVLFSFFIRDGELLANRILFFFQIMASTHIRVNEPGSTQVFNVDLDEDNGLSSLQLDRVFLDIRGIPGRSFRRLDPLKSESDPAQFSPIPAAGPICPLKFKEESQKFYPHPNEEWDANVSYFPRFEHLQRSTLPRGSYSTKVSNC
ncbi:unnamed protein product [Adineta ricciae]|uniref:Uncharacterized protein n=1 Tax=Adineta ricciae TaxID=249248 RepID=A0A816CF89_ADIRI|nr:unnamed protein product [Adineta ricciae]